MPAYKAGGPIHSINNLVNELNEDYQFKIFCSNEDVDGSKLNVLPDRWIPYSSNTEVWYASKNGHGIKTLNREIKGFEPSVLFINGIYSWHFNLMPLLFCRVQCKIVSVRGMLHPGALSQKSFKKRIYLLLWKLSRLPRRCSFHASDAVESSYIKNAFGTKCKVFIASNFPKRLAFKEPLSKVAGHLKLISVALISAMKNILPVLQALRQSNDFVHYAIYGAVKDERYWKDCREVIAAMPANIIVSHVASITPPEVEDLLTASHVFILPSKSENFGHAIFESLSAGRPVITSGSTPWKNLEIAKAGINVNPADNSSILNAIRVFAAMDQTEYNKWCVDTARYAGNAITFEDIRQQYKIMFG